VVRPVAALLALALVLAAGVASGAPAAPGITLRLLESGRTVDTRDLIGKKVVVLRFQTSYCKPCARESASLGRLVKRYETRGVEFVAIHVQDTLADVRRFMRTQKVTYPVALDPKLTVGNRFGFKGTPYTVVIDRRGEMVAQIHGASVIGRLPRILDAALADDPARRS
jgi:peroxiredoxin